MGGQRMLWMQKLMLGLMIDDVGFSEEFCDEGGIVI